MSGLSRSKKSTQRKWRPDFRETQTLPDTKVIRTGFLLNFIALSLAMLCLILYGMREYKLQSLNSSVKSLESQVAESTSRNRAILDTNKRFRQSAEVVAEAVAFDSQAVPFHTFIAELTTLHQEGMVLTAIDMQHSSEIGIGAIDAPFIVELQGKVLDTAPSKPAQLLSDYQTAIENLPVLKGKTIDMEMARFNRNNELGDFDFTLLVKIAVEKVPSL